MSFLFNKNEEVIENLKRKNSSLEKKLEIKNDELKRSKETIESLKDRLDKNVKTNPILHIKQVSKNHGHFEINLTTYLKQKGFKHLNIDSDDEFIRIKCKFSSPSRFSKLANALQISKSSLLIADADFKKNIQEKVVYIKWNDVYAE